MKARATLLILAAAFVIGAGARLAETPISPPAMLEMVQPIAEVPRQDQVPRPIVNLVGSGPVFTTTSGTITVAQTICQVTPVGSSP